MDLALCKIPVIIHSISDSKKFKELVNDAGSNITTDRRTEYFHLNINLRSDKKKHGFITGLINFEQSKVINANIALFTILSYSTTPHLYCN